MFYSLSIPGFIPRNKEPGFPRVNCNKRIISEIPPRKSKSARTIEKQIPFGAIHTPAIIRDTIQFSSYLIKSERR